MSDNHDGGRGYEAANLRHGCARCGRGIPRGAGCYRYPEGDICPGCFDELKTGRSPVASPDQAGGFRGGLIRSGLPEPEPID